MSVRIGSRPSSKLDRLLVFKVSVDNLNYESQDVKKQTQFFNNFVSTVKL